MTRFRTVMLAGGISLLFACGCHEQQPNVVVNQSSRPDQFQWLDSTRDSQAWNRIQAAFRQELEPDDPQKVPAHYLPYQYKYVHKIGLFRTAALVIIGYRETKDSPGYDYFNGYSYDLSDGSRRAIVTEPPRPPGTYPDSDVLWMFEVTMLAHFEPSPVPDVVFTYDNCTECEAEHFLASFKYDPGKGWTARQWDKVYSLYLEGDPSPGDDVVSADYLFKIKGWRGDGLDEVAVRRREITQVAKGKQKTNDSTTIYKAESGTLVGHVTSDPQEREGINAELCSDSKFSFCRQSK